MRNKGIAAIVAGGLLVGAGLVTSAVSSPATATAQEDDANGDAAEAPRAFIQRGLDLLEEVLDELVEDGTLTTDQADAVLDGVDEKTAEVREELEALREEHRALRQEIRELLDDDVITEDEVSELPEDHFLLSDRFDEAWEDGSLTIDEIREATHFGPLRRSFRHGLRFGSLFDDGGIDRSEYDSLPDDHPLKRLDLDDALEDGTITPDEIRGAIGELDLPDGFWFPPLGDDPTEDDASA